MSGSSPSAGPPPNVGTSPVRFDDAAADAAVTQLVLCATAVNDAVVIYQQQLAHVTDGWTGMFRSVFDVESQAVVQWGMKLSADMLTMATTIRQMQMEADAANSLYKQTHPPAPLGPGPSGANPPPNVGGDRWHFRPPC